MKPIASPEAPRPVAAYSQAIEAGGFVFTAGQVGIDPSTGVLGHGLEDQATLAFSNIAAVLRAAGLDASHVAKMTVFVTDLSQFGIVNAVFERFVGDHRPARSTVGVAALPLGALIEVEAIAVRG
jgi:2-iminobutanoate/2-iminopropanoate deaminase